MVRNKGFTLPEIAASLLIVVVLIAVMGPRLLRVQADAEVAQVELVATNIRSALSLHVSEAIGRSDGMAQIKALVGSNPVNLLEQPLIDYLGEVSGWNTADFLPGKWVYNLKEQTLCYRPQWPKAFSLEGNKIDWLELKLVAVLSDKEYTNEVVRQVFSGIRLEKKVVWQDRAENTKQ